MWKNHPKGLAVLFFTEMWERFGYYTMLSLLTLYMDEHFHLSKPVIGQVYGIFLALSYFTPILGGFVADKWLGYSKSIILGAVLMGLGYVMLTVDNLYFFYLALLVVVFGSCFLKPNISTMLGNLYSEGDSKKDSGYQIFYMGINIGAFFAPLVAAYMRSHFGWSYAFIAASLGMVVSLGIFIIFSKYLTMVAATGKTAQANTAQLTQSQEKNGIMSLFIIYGIVIIFWLAFYQNGLTLTFWARDNTNTTLKPELFQAVNPFFIVVFTPILVWVWSLLRNKNKEPSTPSKLAFGMLLTALAFSIMTGAALSGGDTGKTSILWLVTTYAVITLAEICLSPMGLSLANKLSPPRMRGLMMGCWFAATAIGKYLSGFLGGYWEAMPHSRFFGILVVLSIIAFILMLFAKNKINSALNERAKA
ncbi:MAG: peptide MFS transporter [Deltaproteobacteria bacterium]|nr:peptide MFS transporter [Deltaproteobacteria bacterium]